MTPKLLKELFYRMLRIRMIEEKIADLYPEQEMRCPVHLCIGQEAVAVGVCANLSRADYVFSGHRSHGHYLAKGGDFKAMLAELYGKKTGCSEGKGGSMHLVDLSAGFLGATPVVGSTIPIAVGAALGTMLRGERRVTAVFFGEAAVEEGVFHESINFAVLKKLPVIFICENNFFSVYSPLSVRQPERREIFKLARGYGAPGFQADGNDLFEVCGLAESAVRRAQQGGGPTFLEFKTYRWREHCGPNYDNDLGYRTEAEFQSWKKRCPVEKLKKHLVKEGIFNIRDTEGMSEKIQKEIEEAIAFARKSPFPEKSLLMENIYA
ncbi:MAG: thiamine pyrophosphate-dependent dehydrogenase E1 component subunit alpha [Candidatus Ratteibacteria bacterium]|jgi:pyruvate dehydrogenase E1 component alpha subunit